VTRRTSATLFIAAMGLAIAIAVLPFIFGLLGAPILAVTFDPLHRWLRARTGPKRASAAVVAAAVLAIFLPVIGISLLVFSELPAVLASPEITRLIETLGRLRIGQFEFGQQLAAAGSDVVAWISRQAVAFVGGLTFVAINLLIALLGLYFLLLADGAAWAFTRRYLPFSDASVDRLAVRFHDVTRATILGIGATAVAQGVIVGGAFALLGLGHAVLWGTVTGLASVLPVLGTSLVWVPGAIVLLLDHRYVDATVLLAIGVIIASNVDNVIRPMVFRRVSDVHPLIAVVGAFAGMRVFGLLGLLLGPLALVYFFELLRAYEHDHGGGAAPQEIRHYRTKPAFIPDTTPRSRNAS
jgi:predicted PurR-regulated permease PerM